MILAERLASLIAASALVVAASGSAQAQTIRVPDPAGDGFKGHALDITGLRIANRAHHVSVVISFVRVTPGDLGVSFKRRSDRKLVGGVVSTHTQTKDRSKLFSTGGLRACRHLVVRWEPRPDQVRIVIPSHCLAHGNFGALKAQLITEIGSDADYAPNPVHRHFGYTRWVRRG